VKSGRPVTIGAAVGGDTACEAAAATVGDCCAVQAAGSAAARTPSRAMERIGRFMESASLMASELHAGAGRTAPTSGSATRAGSVARPGGGGVAGHQARVEPLGFERIERGRRCVVITETGGKGATAGVIGQ